jgi:hypothetical protein
MVVALMEYFDSLTMGFAAPSFTRPDTLLLELPASKQKLSFLAFLPILFLFLPWLYDLSSLPTELPSTKLQLLAFLGN